MGCYGRVYRVVRRHGGTVGFVGWCGGAAARSGLSDGAAAWRHGQRYHWEEGWERRGGGERAGGGCIVRRLRGEERNTPPRSLYYLQRACTHTHSTKQSQPGASPRAHSIYIASGTPYNPSAPGLDRVMGHDDRGRDRIVAVEDSGEE